MSKVICLASPKGGSGKTSIAASFGVILAAIGKRTLLVDTDSATNGLTLLFLKETRLQAEFTRAEGLRALGAFETHAERGKYVATVLGSNLSLVPATYAFENTDQLSGDAFKANLKRIIAYGRSGFDYVILDAQAGSDTIASIAMSRDVCDEVVIVSEYDPMSAAGVERLKALFPEDLVYSRTWVLLNKMLPEFVQSFSTFLEIARYLSPIPWSAEVVRAYARRRLAVSPEGFNEHSLAYVNTIRPLLDSESEDALDDWLSRNYDELSIPLKTQSEAALSSYLAAREALDKLEAIQQKRQARFRWIAMATQIIVVCLAIGSALRMNQTNSSAVVGAALQVTLLTAAAGTLFTALLKLYDRPPVDNQRREEMQALTLAAKEKAERLATLATANIETLVKLKS